MDIPKLKAEITTDPLTRGYAGMTDQQVVDDINTKYRPADGTLADLMKYLASKKHTLNTATDSAYSVLSGRLQHVANSAVGDNPFGRAAGNEVTLVHKHACQSFVDMLYSNSQSNVNFDDVNLAYGQVQGAGVWSSTHIAEMKALSQNKQSRANELGLGYVKIGDVINARA